jgi:hypothetical protein
LCPTRTGAKGSVNDSWLPEEKPHDITKERNQESGVWREKDERERERERERDGNGQMVDLTKRNDIGVTARSMYYCYRCHRGIYIYASVKFVAIK